jgi:hypothetical protein
MKGTLDVLKLNFSRQNHGVVYIGMVVFRRLEVEPVIYLSLRANSSMFIANEIFHFYRSR